MNLIKKTLSHSDFEKDLGGYKRYDLPHLILKPIKGSQRVLQAMISCRISSLASRLK